MSYVQLAYPNLNQKTSAGWCLKFAQDSFGAPVMHATATIAANATKHRNYSRDMPNVAVPVWFWHYGTYNGVSGEYGHVVDWVPGRGFLSSPVSGFGQLWLSSIEEVEKTFNAKYRFWSLDINTLLVAEPVKEPTPESGQEEDEDDMWKPTVHLRVTGTGKFMEGTLAHPQIGLDLKPGEMREEITSAGKANVYRGFKASGDEAVVAGWQAAYAKGPSTASSKGATSRDAYIDMQAAQQQMSIDLFGVDGRGFFA